MQDGVELAPSSLADLKRLAEAYKAVEKKVQASIRKGLRDAAKPLAREVIKQGSAELPQRGGLRARIARSTPGITTSLATRSVSVSLRLTDREKDSLKGLDTGILRHPVFENRNSRRHGSERSPWAEQHVPARKFTEAFERGAPHTREVLGRAVQQALDDIARKA